MVTKFKVIKKFYVFSKGDILEVIKKDSDGVYVKPDGIYVKIKGTNADEYFLVDFFSTFRSDSSKTIYLTNAELDTFINNEYIIELVNDNKESFYKKELDAAYETINTLKNQVAELRKVEIKSEQLLSVIIELMDVYEEDLEIADKEFNSSNISASAWAERTTVLNNLIKVLGELRKVYNQNSNTENK